MNFLYVIRTFPRVLLIENNSADGNISLVMLIMLICASGSTFGNIAGIIDPMNMNAITAMKLINMLAPVRTVFATEKASGLFFSKYSEKIGINAAINAPAMNRLKSMSGIKKDAL